MATGHRISPATPGSMLYSLGCHVLSLPQPIASPRMARMALPGEGEDWRVRHAVDDYKRYDGWLLIAPFNRSEKTTQAVTVETIQKAPYWLGRMKNVFIGEHAEHTREQAEWLYELHRGHSFESIVLYASTYHVVRAYLTILKYFLDQDCMVPLFAKPTPVPPDIVSPENAVESWELIHGEAKRIEAYQKMGYVATAEELRRYMQWLWKQPCVEHY